MASARDRRDIPDDVARAADAWFIRANNPEMTPETRVRFEAWLAADPLHRVAFDDAGALWARLDEPVARLAAQPAVTRIAPARSPVWRYVVVAATIAASLVIGALVWRDPGFLDRAFADHATRPGERRDVALADGSRVYLDGDSAITTRFEADHRNVRILRGRAWFDVAPDASRPFEVSTDALKARVVGTAFGMDHDQETVVVEHGTVAVSLGGGGDLRLGAGEGVGVRDGQLGTPGKVDLDSALGWRRGLIVLDAAPLGRVVDELSHMAPGRVIIPDGSVRRLTLSGVFQADNPDAVIEAMHRGLGLKIVAIPGFATVVYR